MIFLCALHTFEKAIRIMIDESLKTNENILGKYISVIEN